MQIFDGYEKEFLEFTASISRNTASLPSLDGGIHFHNATKPDAFILFFLLFPTALLHGPSSSFISP